MALYFTKELKTKPNAVSAWSKASTGRPLCALSSAANAVAIYTEEGLPLVPGNEALIKNIRGSQAAQLSWHPHLMLLVVGWKDGAISFWNANERRLNEDSKTHRCPVVAITWSPDGAVLATADQSGKVSLWSTDEEMHPIPIAEYEESNKAVSCMDWGETPEEDGGCSYNLFYAAADDAKSTIISLDTEGRRTELFTLDDPLLQMFYYPEKEHVVCISKKRMLTTHAKDEDGDGYKTLMKMKFATSGGEAADDLKVAWTCPHTLSSACEKDNVIRMYNFNTEDNYVLKPGVQGVSLGENEKIACLSYDQRFGALAVGTTSAKVFLFRHVGLGDNSDEDVEGNLEKIWEQEGMCTVGGVPLKIQFGPVPRLFNVRCAEDVTLCRQAELQTRMRDKLVAMQISANEVVVEYADGSLPRSAKSSLQISGLDVSKEHVMIWDGKEVEVYDITTHELRLNHKFPIECSSLAMHNDSIYRSAPGRLEVCNLAGTVKQTLPFDEEEGSPTHIDVNKDVLCTISDNLFIRLFKIGGRAARPCGPPKALDLDIDLDIDEEFGNVTSIRVNCDGSKVSVLGAASDQHSRDPRVLVFDVETASTTYYDFSCDARVPERHCWDSSDPRLLSVQTKYSHGPFTITNPLDEAECAKTEVAALFASQDRGLLLQDFQAIDPSQDLVGSVSPNLMLFRRPTINASANLRASGSFLAKTAMKCFEGMTHVDDKTKKALLDFSYYLSVGATDDAVKAIKMIHNPTVWENMAQLCIMNRRLDVAELCLTNMEHLRGARALRESQNLRDVDARVGVVAVHMNMVEDSKKLFQRSKRYDMLNKLHQACGEWNRALGIAEKHDRIHLKETHFKMAKHYELIGDYRAAIREYEIAGRHQREVPRMLYDAGKLEELERYIRASGDPELLSWWARYCESEGNVEGAVQCYEKAEDTLALVRTSCYQGDYERAESIVKETKNMAAAFHLGRQYEAQERIPEAIRCFSLAGRHRYAVRLSKQYGMVTELMALALRCPPEVMLEAAEYFNEQQEWDKAVTLYHQGGMSRKAIEMCIAGELFSTLENILTEVDDDGDAELIANVASTLLQHGELEKASKMLLKAGQPRKALELCIQHDIVITEEMADRMTPDSSSCSPSERNAILCTIAKTCKHQGSFHIAAKKYSEAGERLKAAKAIIKSGDTGKIIVFASRSRQREIYMLAANYLQTQDWRGQEQILKHIISFYSKAKAYESLAGFYDTCAQIEIDEQRDYDKGLQAMNNALKYAKKSESANRDVRLASLNQRLDMMERFVTARKSFGQNSEEATEICMQLLEEITNDIELVTRIQTMEAAVRIGDVYALLIEFFHAKGDMQNAFKLMEEMKSRNIIVTAYIDRRTLEAVHQEMGIQMTVRATTEDEDIVEESLMGQESDSDVLTD